MARLSLTDLPRERPRDYDEWRILVSWGKASPGEEQVIGYRLRQVREEAGLTQRQLAERVAVTQQAVSAMERWSANPSWRQILRWCRACGVEPQLDTAPSRRAPAPAR